MALRFCSTIKCDAIVSRQRNVDSFNNERYPDTLILDVVSHYDLITIALSLQLCKCCLEAIAIEL